jgi:HAD superfamily hydrolase (TIGR01509 family)
MIRPAVGFDFDRTLGTDNGLERRAFGLLAEQFGTSIDIDEPQTAAAIEEFLAPFRAAEESMSAMLARFVATLPANAHSLDVNPDALGARYRQICYDLVAQMVQPEPGAVECIAALVASGIPVGILTNGWSELQQRKIAHALGDFPGPVLVSDTLGAYKPSAAAFAELEAALGVDSSCLWYVGDSPAVDIAGARAYGIRAVWLNRDGAAYPADLAEPTAVIDHLDALPALVRGA